MYSSQDRRVLKYYKDNCTMRYHVMGAAIHNYQIPTWQETRTLVPVSVVPLGLDQRGGAQVSERCPRGTGLGVVRQPVQGAQLAERQQHVFGVQEHPFVGRAITVLRHAGQDDHLMMSVGRAAVRGRVRVQEPREQRERGGRVGGGRGERGQQTGVEHVLVVELFVHVHHGRHAGVRVLELDHDGHAAPLRSGQRDRAENDVGHELVAGRRRAVRVVRAERRVNGARPERALGRGPRERDRVQVIRPGRPRGVVGGSISHLVAYSRKIGRKNRRETVYRETCFIVRNNTDGAPMMNRERECTCRRDRELYSITAGRAAVYAFRAHRYYTIIWML